MPEMVPQEVIEFLTRFGGATVSSIEQYLLEWYWTQHPEMRGKFPYTRPEEHLPMYSDLIVGGIQIPFWVAGMLVEDDAKKKGDTKTVEMAKIIREFGEGGLLYAAPMIVHNTAVTDLPHKTAAAPAGQPPGQGAGSPPPAAIMYKF